MADGLDDQARAWIVRLHSGRASAADRDAHQIWCAADPAHARAWDDANRTWSLLGELGTSADIVNAEVSGSSRRLRSPRLAASIAALAACYMGVWLYRPMPLTALFVDAATAPGEQRELMLEDGSRVAMTGATLLNWKLKGPTREVELVEGEAMFEVAHDAARPFMVRAGDAHIRVTGTKFSVRHLGGDTLMMLAQGSVDASAASESRHIAIAPGQGVRWAGSATMRVEPIAIEDVGAWRRGRLIVRSRPLGELLDELGLYRHGRILALGDVGSIRVTGVFNPADPDRALVTLAQSLPIRVDRYGPITLVRRAD